MSGSKNTGFGRFPAKVTHFPKIFVLTVSSVSEESLAMIVSMGFTSKQAAKALQQTDNNLDRAIDWIFSHPEDNGDSEAPADPSGGFTDGKPSE